MTRDDGYKPRHKSVTDKEFCDKGCMIIDDIKVPFPDCFTHGNPFTIDSKCHENCFTTDPKYVIIRSLAPKR